MRKTPVLRDRARAVCRRGTISQSRFSLNLPWAVQKISQRSPSGKRLSENVRNCRSFESLASQLPELRGKMNSKHNFFVLIPALILLSIPLRAQEIPAAQEWLTTVDRSALFAQQPEALQFSDAKGDPPTIIVNDMQQFQPIEGFGFALTGGV